MQLSIRVFYPRNKLQLTFPAFWEIARAHFDGVLYTEAEHFLVKGKVDHYVKRHRNSLGLFLDLADLDVVLQAALDKKPAPLGTLERIFNASTATQVLFKEQAVRKDTESFLASMKGRLDELESNDFLEEDVDAYRTLCFQEASILATSH